MGIDNGSIENSAITVNGDVKLLSSNTSVIDASLLSTAIAVDRIKIEKGVRAGDVYEYLGSAPLSNLNEQADFLLVQDYGDLKDFQSFMSNHFESACMIINTSIISISSSI